MRGRGFVGRRRVLSFTLVCAVAAGATAAAAPTEPKATAHPPAPKKSAPFDGGSPFGRAPAQAAPSTALAGAGAVDAGVVEARTLDGGTRVFKFKELDIEGRLKSPQLVYFLRRVRAEFGAEDLGHRSFLREMSETRKESSF